MGITFTQASWAGGKDAPEPVCPHACALVHPPGGGPSPGTHGRAPSASRARSHLCLLMWHLRLPVFRQCGPLGQPAVPLLRRDHPPEAVTPFSSPVSPAPRVSSDAWTVRDFALLARGGAGGRATRPRSSSVPGGGSRRGAAGPETAAPAVFLFLFFFWRVRVGERAAAGTEPASQHTAAGRVAGTRAGSPGPRAAPGAPPGGRAPSPLQPGDAAAAAAASAAAGRPS